MKDSSNRVVVSLAVFSVGILAQAAMAQSPADVSSYWSTTPGDTLFTQAKLFENGELIQSMSGQERIVGLTECEGRPCVAISMKHSFTPSSPEDNTSEVVMYQVITENEACTSGYESADGTKIDSGCTFLDLVGPVVKGKSWQFSDSQPLLEPLIFSPVDISFSSVIAETDLELNVGDHVFSGCIRVSREGRATPATPIQCADGAISKVTTSLVLNRWFCPGVGSVRETSTETHTKAESIVELCAQHSSEFLATGFSKASDGSSPN